MAKLKAVAYARYSSDNQREESIDAQLRAIRKYAEENNIVIIKTYVDRAMTARSDKRPQFQQMIMDSRKGIFDAAIVHKLNRFSRNKYDAAKYKHKLLKNNVNLISVIEKLDDTPESGIMESLLIGMAQYESENLAREVLKGSLENAQGCKHNGGLPPLGYSVDEKTQLYVVNENTKHIVEFIFKSYLSGYGYNWIKDELSKKGYITTKGNKFSVPTIKDILRNEKYTGTYIYNKAVAKDADGKRKSHKCKSEEEIVKVEGGLPAIISKKDFESVQKIMVKNKEIHNTFNAKEVYLLSGLIFCGECGSKMVGNVSYRKSENEKQKYIMYRCNNRASSQKEHIKSIRKDTIEDYILFEMEKMIFCDEAIKHLSSELSKFCDVKQKQMEDESKYLRSKLSKVEKEIENIISAVAEGNKHKSLMDRLTKLEGEKEDIEISIEEIKLKYPILEPINEKYLRNIFNRHKTSLEEKNLQLIKKFINLYIEKVFVYNDHIKVVFKLSPLLVECTYGETYHK